MAPLTLINPPESEEKGQKMESETKDSSKEKPKAPQLTDEERFAYAKFSTSTYAQIALRQY